jgi:hypothetical protein
MLFSISKTLAALSAAALFCTATAFVAPATLRTNYYAPTTSLRAAAVSISNPFKKLPWNVRKEKEREARRFKQERAVLHRQLGIAEDASYEEIVIATDSLIARAGSDLKAKVKVEIAKDRILQIRLNERLAGLSSENRDARSMSRFEDEG